MKKNVKLSIIPASRSLCVGWCVIFLLISVICVPQNVGINVSNPDSSALLDLTSTEKGLLIPRMTTDQRNAIDVSVSPNSVMIFNTTTKCFEFYYDGSWYELGCATETFTCGTSTVDDPDGYTYPIVLIGTQCWMAEDLRYDGDPGGTGCTGVGWVDNTDVGWCGYYTGGPYANEGLLYQWSAAMNDSTAELAQGLCPTGWHIPTDAEYCTLEQYICDNITAQNPCLTTFDCSVAFWRGQNTTTAEGEGSAMAGYEAKWTNGKLDNNGVGNNDFGTSGLLVPPSGQRNGSDGSYELRSNLARLWSSSESGGTAWTRTLNNTDTRVYRNTTNKAYCVTVRCLKD